MICVAISKQRSMRLARMWNIRSPGVETAWRSRGANLPERVQFRRPRRPEEAVPRVGPDPHDAGESCFQVAKFYGAQNQLARSPQNESSVARLSGPGLSVATRKMAARVSGADTGCATADNVVANSDVLFGSGFINAPLRLNCNHTKSGAQQYCAFGQPEVSVNCRSSRQ